MSIRILFKPRLSHSDPESSEARPDAIIEFDPLTGELKKNGIRLRFLSPQGTSLLSLLVNKQSEVATFDEIVAAIWGDEESTADKMQPIREHMTTLRQLLCDSKAHPRFLETVPRKGYRFVGLTEEMHIPTSPSLGNKQPEPSSSSMEVAREKTEDLSASQNAHATLWASQSAEESQLIPETAVALTPNTDSRQRKRPPAFSTWKTPVYLLAGCLILAAAVLITLDRAKGRNTGIATPLYPIPRVLAGLSREGKSVRRVSLPSAPGRSAISSDGQFMFSPLYESGTVAVVDLLHARLHKEIPLGGNPHSIASSKDGHTLFLNDLRDGIHILDLIPEKALHIPTGGPVNDVALAPDGRRLYLAMARKGLKRFDVATGTIHDIPSVICPMILAVSAADNALYVSCRCGGPGGRDGHDNIDVLNLSTERSVKVFGNGAPIVGGDIASSPDSSQIWIDGGDACDSPRYDHQGCPAVPSGVLHAFRSTDGRLLKSLPVQTPGAIGFTPDAKNVLFGINSRLYVFDTSAMRLVESAQTNAGHTYFSPLRPEMYTTSQNPNELRIVRLPPSACQLQAGNFIVHLPADGVAIDLASAGHATLHGGAAYGTGIFGQAFQFDGKTAFVELPSDGGGYGLRIEPTHTSSFWLKPYRTGADETLTERLRADGTIHWRVHRRPDARIAIQVFPTSGEPRTVVSHQTVPSGVWSSISFTSTQEKLALFLNGIHQSDLPGSFQSDTRGARSRFGAGFKGNHYAGLIDEIIVRPENISPNGHKIHHDAFLQCFSADW